MNYLEFKELVIKKCLTFLSDAGFKVKSNTLGAVIFIQKTNNFIYTLGCYHSKYGNIIINNSIGAGIICLEIENIFAPLAVKNGLCGKSLKPDTNSTLGINKISGFEQMDYSRYQTEIVINNESDVDILVDSIKEYYLTKAVPAFAAFTSIEQLVPMMEKLEFYDFTKNFGMGSQFKKAIVWKLCNKLDCEEYMIDLIERTEKFLGPNRDQVEGYKWYNTALELKEILDNAMPKYNL